MLRELFELLFPPQCGACGAIGSGACDRCMPRAPALVRTLPTLEVTALGTYDGPLRQIVLALKRGRRDVARTLGERTSALLSASDLIVPVPTTAARRRERGFDGCMFLARIASEQSGCGVIEALAQTAGDRQRGRSRDSRLAARGRFRVHVPPLRGARVTLLDDVVTTGATLEDCAHALRAAGAIVQRAIAVAVA